MYNNASIRHNRGRHAMSAHSVEQTTETDPIERLAALLVELGQLVVISAVGLALGWDPGAGVADLPVLLLVVLAGTFAFAALGLLVAGVLRAEATLAAANLVYLLLLAGGAVVIPAASYGAWGSLAAWLPSGALGEAMRAVLDDASLPGVPLLVLRDKTERPEGIAGGSALVVGTSTERIVTAATRLLGDPVARAAMSRRTFPYGDGRAAERTVSAIAELLGVGERLPAFDGA